MCPKIVTVLGGKPFIRVSTYATNVYESLRTSDVASLS